MSYWSLFLNSYVDLFVFLSFLLRWKVLLKADDFLLETFRGWTNISGRLSPFLEMFRGIQSCSGVGISFTLSLPPRCIILAHNLKNISLFERKPGFLTWNCFILIRVIVKEGFDKHLAFLRWPLFFNAVYNLKRYCILRLSQDRDDFLDYYPQQVSHSLP